MKIKSKQARRLLLCSMLAVPMAISSPSPASGSTAAVSTHSSIRRRSDDSRQISAEQVAAAGQYIRRDRSGLEQTDETRAAWKKFYAACDSAIAKFASKVGLRGEDLDDCRQDVWAELVKKLPELQIDESRGKFSTWLYTVVRSKAVDGLRKRERSVCNGDAALAGRADIRNEPAMLCQKADDRDQVRTAILKLKEITSPMSFRVAELRWVEQRPVAEVASELGMSAEQVWVREHRMKQKLRGLLEV